MEVDARFEAALQGIRLQGGFGPEPGYYVSEVDGLLSGGEVVAENAPRGFGPGAHDTDNRREDPRIVTFRGLIIAASMWQLGTMIDELGAILSEETDRTPLVWTEFGRWRTTTVRRGAGWSITPIRATGTAAFTIRFRAPDQRIYAAETQMTAWGVEVPVRNRGGYPAPVIAEVRGNSAGGYVLYGPRESAVVVTRAITAGSVHRYYGDTGLLEVGGAPQTTGVTRSDRIDIPRGAFTFVVTNGCEVRISWADTWVP
ncbi:hypothetical protein ACFZA2_01785 [Microbacterium sp. NPDC007973]|uniref:hypothetical protein n=1 Tax=Microbacterium sp. NPDC007973 TaxID=3364182 RepID=UPI0036E75B12